MKMDSANQRILFVARLLCVCVCDVTSPSPSALFPNSHQTVVEDHLDHLAL